MAMTEPGISITIAEHSRLRMDVRLGRLDTIYKLLAREHGFFDKEITAESGRRRAGDFLLNEAILTAHIHKNQDLVDFLLTRKASTSETYPGALADAVISKDMILVDKIQSAGWSPDICPPSGKTAMAVAAELACQGLIRKWAKYLPLGPDSKGNNLLHHLCRADFWGADGDEVLETARFLVQGNEDWQQVNAEGKTPGQLCNYPGVAEQIDVIWRQHRSKVQRQALTALANKVRTQPAESIPPPKM